MYPNELCMELQTSIFDVMEKLQKPHLIVCNVIDEFPDLPAAAVIKPTIVRRKFLSK